MLKVFILITGLSFAVTLSGQVMKVNGTTINQSGGGPNDCNEMELLLCYNQKAFPLS